MQVLIRSRQSVQSVRYLESPYAIVSIRNPFDPDVSIPTDHHHCRGVLRLVFADVETEMHNHAITEDQAAQIWSFVQTHKDCGTIVCQCEAGQSRSAGVAAALAKIFNDSDTDIYRQTTPNSLVRRRVFAAAGYRLFAPNLPSRDQPNPE